MNALITVASVLSVIGFGTAMVVALTKLPPREAGGSRLASAAFAAAMGLYLFVSLSNFAEYSGVTSHFDLYEDYAELLFVPLLVLASFASESQLLLDERSQSAALLQQQNDLLMNIVDTSPVGIMIVSPGGHITFANDPARNMLSIYEERATGQLVHAAWTMVDPNGEETSLDALVSTEPVTGARRVINFPDGRRQQFLFSVTPMNDATASLGGAVVAVEAAGSSFG